MDGWMCRLMGKKAAPDISQWCNICEEEEANQCQPADFRNSLVNSLLGD